MKAFHIFICCLLLVLAIIFGIYIYFYLILWSRSAVIDFGDNYEYVTDYPYAVVKSVGGYPAKDIIVEGKVLQYDYDNQTIILLTQDHTINKDSLYWVIDKASSYTLSFKDYPEFEQYLRQSGIPLSLGKR